MVQVGAGAMHTVAVTDDGRAMAWGLGTCGQLGTLAQDVTIDGFSSVRYVETQPTPMELPSSVFIVTVGCGTLHTALVDRRGSVFTCGAGRMGQLRHGNARDVFLPQMIVLPENVVIVSVKAGYEHTVFLATNGAIMTCGRGTLGALGHGNFDTCRVPVYVAALRGVRISEIAAGGHATMARTSDGRLYTWGDNNDYVLSRFRTRAQQMTGAAQAASSISNKCFTTPGLAWARRTREEPSAAAPIVILTTDTDPYSVWGAGS